MKIKTEFAIFRYAIDNLHLQKEEDAIKHMKLKKWVAVDDLIEYCEINGYEQLIERLKNGRLNESKNKSNNYKYNR